MPGGAHPLLCWSLVGNHLVEGPLLLAEANMGLPFSTLATQLHAAESSGWINGVPSKDLSY